MLKRTLIVMSLLALPAHADISDEANACIDVLRTAVGSVGGEVVNQSGSEAGTYVLLRTADGTEYECIVWSGPEVAELRPVGGAPIAGSAMPKPISGTERVSFDAGASGKSLVAILEPGTSVRLVLGASAEQFLDVNITSQGGALDYKIENPDGSILLDLIASDTPYRGQLWQSGDHVVEIMNAGAQAVTFDAYFRIE